MGIFRNELRQNYAKQEGDIMATIRKRGDKYRVEVSKNGIRKSATFKSKTEATLWGIEEENKIELQKKGLQPDTLFIDVIRRYQKEVTPTKRAIKQEYNRINRLITHHGWLVDKYIADITTADLETYLNLLLENVKESTARREISIVSNIFTYAYERWKYITQNPMMGLAMPANAKPRTQRFSDEDIEKIISFSGYRNGIKGLRQRVAAAFLFAIETAMRAGEISNLTWDDVSFEKRTAFLSLTKNGSSRTVPLSKEAIRILKQLEEIKSDDSVFGINSKVIDRQFRIIRRNTDLLDLHFHDTRREALSRLAKKVDVMTLAKISGHKDIKILLNTYYAPDMSDVANLLD